MMHRGWRHDWKLTPRQDRLGGAIIFILFVVLPLACHRGCL